MTLKYYSSPDLNSILHVRVLINKQFTFKLIDMKYLLHAFIYLLITTPVFAQSTSRDSLVDRILTKKEMMEDFNFLRRVLQETHPALYRYTPKELMQKKLDSTVALFTVDMPFYDYYLILAALVADIRCAHTHVTPMKEISTYAQKRIKTLPLEIIPIADRFYITVTGTLDDRIKPGSELLSINGRPMPAVRQQIFRHMWADGFIESSKIAQVTGTRFGFYYYLFVERADSFLVRLREPEGQIVEVGIPALYWNSIFSNVFKNPVNKRVISLYKEKNRKEQKNGWRMEIIKSPHAAYLRINGFGGGRDGKEAAEIMRKFMDKNLATLKKKKIENLIIDVRNNGGGWDIQGAELFTYLMKDTTPVRYFYRKHSITDSSEFIKYSDLSPEDRANVKNELKKEADGTFTLKEEYNDDLKIQYAKPNRFTGNIYFLVNGGCGSTTSEFTAVAHSNKLGVFVGEETGGAYEGDNGGSFLHFQLPNSGISVGTPLLYYDNGVKPPVLKGRGVIPDHIVPPTYDALMNGKDTQLEFALELIRKKAAAN